MRVLTEGRSAREEVARVATGKAAVVAGRKVGVGEGIFLSVSDDLPDLPSRAGPPSVNGPPDLN